MSKSVVDKVLMQLVRQYRKKNLTRLGFERRVSAAYAQIYSGSQLSIAIDTFMNTYG